MDDRSIWKKEISFRRKPAEHSSDPDAPATSIWKKEISFGRKRTVDEPTTAQTPAPADAAPAVVPEPVQPAPAALPAAPPVQTVPAPAPLPAAPVQAPAVEAPVVAPAALPATVEPVPFWKREIAIGKRAPAEATTPVPSAEASVPPRAEPAVREPEGSAIAQFEPAPVAVQPPAGFSVPPTIAPEPRPAPVQVPAAEVPTAPLLQASPAANLEHVPFWKREVVIGRRGPAKATAPVTAKRSSSKRPKASKAKVDRGSRGAKKLVGLKIGASQLSAARVSNNGAAELLQIAREPLTAGVVAGGEVRDPDALGVALKAFFAKHKLPKRGVRLGIANNRIGVRTFDLAGIQDSKQLDNAIRFRAQEVLPIPIDEAVLDYQVLGEVTNDEGQPVRRVLLVVAYREQIDRYLDACKKAGITLAGIDLEAFALLRALQAPQQGAGQDPSAALVAVAIGHERSTFAVSDGTVCEFTRVLDWGGAALNVALARVLNAAPSEVEAVKRSLSLADDSTPEGLTSEQAVQARDAVRRAIQAFARELVSSLQFYQNQPGSLGIGEIVLSGGTAHLPGLAPELERLVGVRVRIGDPLARMKVSKRIKEPQQVGSLAVAIGLGIED